MDQLISEQKNSEGGAKRSHVQSNAFHIGGSSGFCTWSGTVSSVNITIRALDAPSRGHCTVRMLMRSMYTQLYMRLIHTHVPPPMPYKLCMTGTLEMGCYQILQSQKLWRSAHLFNWQNSSDRLLSMSRVLLSSAKNRSCPWEYLSTRDSLAIDASTTLFAPATTICGHWNTSDRLSIWRQF